MSCFDKLKEQYPQLKDAEVRFLVDEFARIKNKYQTRTSMYNQARKDLVNDFNEAKLQQRKADLNHVVKLNNNVKHILQPNFKNDPVEGILSLIEGTSRKVDNSLRTVENIMETIEHRTGHGFIRELEANKTLEAFSSGEFDYEIISELYGRGFAKHEPSKNPIVTQVADAVEKLNKILIKTQQDAGSTITYRRGYAIKMTHNQDLILADLDGWKKIAIETLDLEKSFGADMSTPEGAKKIDKALTSYAQRIEEQALGRTSFMGDKRKFIFKDGDSFAKYNESYGYNNLLNGVLNSIKTSSRSAALVEMFGNKPRKGLDDLIDSARKIQPKNISDQKIKKIEHAMDYLAGVGNRPGEGAAYNIFQNVRRAKSLTYLQMLGGTGFTSMNDFAMIAISAQTTSGKGLVDSHGRMLYNLIASFGQNKKKLADALAVSFDEPVREILESASPSKKGVDGTLSFAVDKYMIMNGTAPVTTWTRKTAAMVAGEQFTDLVMSKNLTDFEKQTIREIGLTDTDIRNLRAAHEAYSDSPILDVNAIRSFDFKMDTDGLPIEKYRFKLQTKVGSFFNEKVADGSPKMRNKQARQMGKHIPQDDIYRSAAEVFGTFKSTLLRSGYTTAKLARKSNDGDLVGWNSVKGVAPFLVTAGVLNWMIDVMRDAVEGKEYKPITPKKLAAHMVQSGAAGVVADMGLEVISTEGRHMGRAPSPITGTMNKLIKAGWAGDKDAVERSWDALKIIAPSNFWFYQAVKNRMIDSNSSQSVRR